MTLEDFEKALAAEQASEERKPERHQRRHGDRRSHRHHRDRQNDEHKHPRKRKRRSSEASEDDHLHRRRYDEELPRHQSRQKRSSPENEVYESRSPTHVIQQNSGKAPLKRDEWMEAPVQEISFRNNAATPIEPISSHSAEAEFKNKLHRNEMNRHRLEDSNQRDSLSPVAGEVSQQEVDYVFGDSGSQWRLTKLRGVYRLAEETGESVDDIALKQYGDLRLFDDAREEQIEVDRRKTYGEGYVGHEVPSGDLFQERNLTTSHRATEVNVQPIEVEPAVDGTAALDQSALNKLKAQLMKARIRHAPEVAELEAQFEGAMAALANQKEPKVVVLNKMENRLLAGGRGGEVKKVDNRRGLERGLVEENEDMTIGDMVREERRSKGEPGGEGKRFAERIAKDAKFNNDLEYMDDNAQKLAKRVQKSELNLRNVAIADLKKTSLALDNCPLCYHDDTGQPPIAPVVALATRTYLTLPTEPEIVAKGACIVPVQHRKNLLECDDDEWEEIRNFMKALTRMYAEEQLGVLFYENAARPERHQHALLSAVPAPRTDLATAPAFFREAILQQAPEWAQHKKIIDTATAAKEGLGRTAFRRSIAKQMPYFHVWFTLDGGLGHVVEDSTAWPKADLFAREVLGEVLQKDFGTIRAKGRWVKDDKRLDGFKKLFEKFDWTKMLIEEGG